MASNDAEQRLTESAEDSQAHAELNVITSAFFSFSPDFARVVADVMDERQRQVVEWGGPSTDDGRDVSQWVSFMLHQLSRTLDVPAHTESVEDYLLRTRERFIKVAALAMAAIESADRTRMQLARHRDGA